MAAKKPAESTTPAKYKKGEVTIDGHNFNDAWARGLKALPVEGGDPIQPKERFVSEFAHSFPEMEPDKRKEVLETAFQACLDAED